MSKVVGRPIAKPRGEDMVYNLAAMEQEFAELKEKFHFDELDRDELQMVALGLLENGDRYRKAYLDLLGKLKDIVDQSKTVMY